MASARKDNKGRVLLKGESYRQKDNRYQYAYRDIYGKTRYIYSKDIISLRKREEELLRDNLEGIDSSQASRQTLNNMYDKYMVSRSDLSPRTVASYSYQYDAYVRNTIGKRKVSSIRYSDILLFYLDIMEKNELCYATIEHLHRIINPVFTLAVRDNIIRNNPASKVLEQLKRQTCAKRNKRFALTSEQQKAFLEFMDGHIIYNHWKSIFVFLLGTGLRVSELSALTWDDIDFDSGVISVERSVTYFSGKKNKSKQKLFMSPPKTYAGIRKIPMVEEVVKALIDAKQYQIENDIVCTDIIDGYTNFVFLDRFGGTYLQHNLDRALKRVIKAYNEYAKKEIEKRRNVVILPDFTCHSLRHTFCTRLCESEANIKVIQSLMGHVDIDTTMNIYAEVSESKKKESLNSLADKLLLF